MGNARVDSRPNETYSTHYLTNRSMSINKKVIFYTEHNKKKHHTLYICYPN